MKRILGNLLLCLLGFSSCQSITIPASSPSTTQTAIKTSDAENRVSSIAVTPAYTPTSSPSTATPSLGFSDTQAPILESTNLLSATAEIGLTRAIEIYRSSYCGTCHTLTTAETSGTFGPGQDDIGLIAEQRIRDPNYTGSATNAADYLLESLLEPQAYIVAGYELSRHNMPSFTHLSDDDLQAIVFLLLQQK